MIGRRDFLTAAARTSAGAMLFSPLLATGATAGRKLKNIVEPARGY